MRYFIDTEFNAFQGELISIALCAEDGRELYLTVPNMPRPLDPWVAEHVMPVIAGTEEFPAPPKTPMKRSSATMMVGAFLAIDPEPVIFADWPEDIAHLMNLLILEPGKCFPIPQLQSVFVDIESFSTAKASKVPHNALWDARALRDFILAAEREEIVAPLVDMGEEG